MSVLSSVVAAESAYHEFGLRFILETLPIFVSLKIICHLNLHSTLPGVATL
jgi:hypothetical protein